MTSSSRYGNERVRRRRALRRLSGRSATHVPPGVLRTLHARDRRSQAGGRRVLAAGGLATLLSSLSATTIVVALLGVALAAGTAIAGYAYFSRDLPGVHTFEAQPFGTTRIYDRHGRLLQEVSDPDLGWRTNVKLDQISPALLAATVAAEDPTFATNPGIDPTGIVRAALINYNGEGSSGGSTITQQLVRALWPKSIGDKITLTRKAREAIQAIRFTKAYSKDEILNLYVNEIYYGNRSYGIEAAAESYFNKHASQLDLAEASMLAGLPQAPSYYDPRYNFAAAKVRQQYVLDQMVKEGYIDSATADAAFAEPLLPRTREGQANDAPHFVNYVRDYIERKYGADKLYRGDLQVYTTLDYDTEVAAEQIVREHVQQLHAKDVTNGALVAIKPATGEILAMVGSVDFYDPTIDGQVNITTRERQPGSSIKPIVYAAAFQQGWSPATRIMDIHSVFANTSQAYGELEALHAQGRDLPPEREQDTSSFYVPENFDLMYHGAVQVRDALANSFNIPAIKTIQYAGIDNVINLAHAMGIRTGLWRGANYYGFTLALGGGEVEPLENTNVYATFANNGRYVAATPILRIVDGLTGKTLEQLDEKQALTDGEQVLAPANAWQITSILTDNVARIPEYGPNSALIIPEVNRPVAAKTGTTNDNRDIWTMGYTTDLAVGVWIGNSNNAKTKGALGGTDAAPIWHDFMVTAHQRPDLAANLVDPAGKPYPIQFTQPSGVALAAVCPGTGKQAPSGPASVVPNTNGRRTPTPAPTPPAAPGPYSVAVPTQRGREDWFPVNQPGVACGVLTPAENDELALALRDVQRNASKYTPGAIESVLAYRNAATNFKPPPYNQNNGARQP